MSSSIQARKDEIAAKKAKLAELKRQREQRQKEFTATRQSLGDPSESTASAPLKSSTRAELDDLVSSLVDRPAASAGPSRCLTPVTSTLERPSSRSSVRDDRAPSPRPQTLAFAPPTTVFQVEATAKPEYVTYSKGVQTFDTWTSAHKTRPDQTSSDDERSPTRRRRRLSRREREQDDEYRRKLRQEIEADMRALHLQEEQEAVKQKAASLQAEQLSRDEIQAVTTSDDYVSFVERSTKVLERALEEDYDVLADYAVGGKTDQDLDDENDQFGNVTTSRDKSRRIREVYQFRDDTLTKTRMVSDLDYSPKYPELLLASYTKASNSVHSSSPGLALIWNAHMPSRPEYKFTATSDILCARFSPHHPNLVLGGTYSGQVCLWDTRQRSTDGSPVQRTPLAGERGGHAHPVYSVAVVGTQNANNIISVSTDGTACAWSFDMLSKPAEHVTLMSPPGKTKTEEVAPTCMAFSKSDQTCFLAGTEEGSLVSVQRYDRAGARAGIDQRIIYKGHSAPVTGIEFHPSRGKVDLGDLVLSCGLDWSVKLWRARPQQSSGLPTTVLTSGGLMGQSFKTEHPLLDIARDETVYDVKWSPVRAGVFGCVDGAGRLDVFDLNVDLEVPVSSARASHSADDVFAVRSLNKLAWEKTDGRRVAVGGLDGVVSVFEVGTGLGGSEGLDLIDDWMGVKKLVSRLDRNA